jgi:hypothetical protein
MKIDDVVDRGIAPFPTVIKADVEGHEVKVFEGAARTVLDQRLKAIVFESLHDGTGRIADRRLRQLFENAGFTLGRLLRSHRNLERNENYIAYRSAAVPSGYDPQFGPA